MIKVLLLAMTAVVVLGLLTACGDVSYYAQCVSGHWEIMRRCRPIDELLSDPSVPDARRQKLAGIQRARTFASQQLALPDNDSYRKFADIGRPYAVWNVVAAPEFSLEPRQWCFPVAGCVSYRGYFDEPAAREEGERLAKAGYEVDVYGVHAYSTLNWFADPVLNTFLDGPELSAASLLFHELAHQVVYVKDDSRFNEAFARTVELEGVRRWLAKEGSADDFHKFDQRLARAAEFNAMLLKTRTELQTLYASPVSDEEKREMKRTILADAGRRYDDLKASWDGYAGYDPWMARGLNNARLASLSTYQDLVPAFQGLLASVNRDLPRFYRQVRELAELAPAERLARLDDQVVMKQARVGQ